MFLKLNSTYLYAVNSFSNRQRERFRQQSTTTIRLWTSSGDKVFEEIKRIYDDTAGRLGVDVTPLRKLLNN
jgi:hypothetical protein